MCVCVCVCEMQKRERRRGGGGGGRENLFVGCLMSQQHVSVCISGTDLLRQFYVLPLR